jgi:protein-arginine kinase activator protein McsA
MLCERCNKEEAVVHFTVISPNGDEKRNLCESCYRESDIAKKIASEGWKCDGPTKKFVRDNGLES